MNVTVSIMTSNLQKSAHMLISSLPTRPAESEIQDFSVRLVVNRGGQITGIHTRLIDGYPVHALNVVALVKTALQQYDMDALVAEDDDSISETDPSDLERGLGRTVHAISTEEESRLRNNGSSIRSGQPEQHGSNS